MPQADRTLTAEALGSIVHFDMIAQKIAAILGLTGVALGAFGAHGLKNILATNDTLAVWQTAVLYHLIHAVAALWAAERRPAITWIWAIGVLIFSGSLYTLALTNIRWLGAITPIGGVLFIIGWALLFKTKNKSA